MMLTSMRCGSLLLALLATRVTGETPDHVSSKLMVQVPEELRKSGGYDHREALFGMPPFGGSLVQKLYYVDGTLCDPDVDKTGGYPVRKDDNGKRLEWDPPFILMVDRGSCTFVTKVRNAQRAGASGVVIADNTCLCEDIECKSHTGITDGCENAEPIMADDGSGSDIGIPSMLSYKHDADPIKEYLKQNKKVQIEMAWSLPNPDDRVEYDLWTTPVDKLSEDFFREWKPLADSLGEHAQFTPHMYIHNGISMGCHATNGDNLCYTLCTNAGRYCATDPDNDLDGGVSGQDIVKESLRRLCIWETYGKDGIGGPFWDYMNHFNTRCKESYFKESNCIVDAYKHANIDGKRIDECISVSGGTEGNVGNKKLDAEVLAQKDRGVVVVPSAFINTAAIRGGLSATTVFSAICAGFSEGTKPEICQTCGSCSDAPGCVASGYCTAGNINGAAAAGGGTVSKHTFVSSMALMMLLFVGVGAWHYKNTQDQMRNQVRGILADYLPLEDQDRPNGFGSPMDFSNGGASTSLMT